METEIYQIPENPSLKEIEEGLAIATNKLGTLAEKQAKIKNVVNVAEDEYKRVWAERYIMAAEEYPKGTQQMLKAITDADEKVVELKNIVSEAKAKSLLADAEFNSWDNVHVSLRKIATMKITEMKSIQG